jgi:hypothetical protein
MSKISISVGDVDLRWLKRRARRLHGGNLSAAIAEGTRLLRHQEALGALLDHLGAPPLTASERQLLNAELEGKKPRRRRRAA